MEKIYPSDLTDDEWNIIKEKIPKAKPGGRPREINIRQAVNGMFYLVKGGIVWRMLPKNFPPWQSVYNYYREWCKNGIWQAINDSLREQVREKVGKHPTPSAAIIDSQSVKSGGQGGPQRGYDAGKKVNGRKRHILVDTMGLILMVVVHSAGVQDRDGAKLVLAKAKDCFPRLHLIWADGGYAGKLIEWVAVHCLWWLEIVKRCDDIKGFVVLPRPWVVERTFAWLGKYRRLTKDYEKLPQTSENMVYLAMIRLMLRRLTS